MGAYCPYVTKTARSATTYFAKLVKTKQVARKTRRASTDDGSVLPVRDQGGAERNTDGLLAYSPKTKQDTRKTRRASTDDGSVLAVRDQDGAECNAGGLLAYSSKQSKTQERQGARAPTTGAYCPYVTEAARSATQYFAVDSLFFS